MVPGSDSLHQAVNSWAVSESVRCLTNSARSLYGNRLRKKYENFKAIKGIRDHPCCRSGTTRTERKERSTTFRAQLGPAVSSSTPPRSYLPLLYSLFLGRFNPLHVLNVFHLTLCSVISTLRTVYLQTSLLSASLLCPRVPVFLLLNAVN